MMNETPVMFDSYYQVSKRLASCKKIKKSHLIIISDTWAFNQAGRLNFKSQERIAAECGMSLRSVNSAIKDLKDWALLTVIETAYKETLKLAVNRQNLIAFIEENETKDLKDEHSPMDKETADILNKTGWEPNKINDTQKLRTPYAKIAQPIRKNCVLKDHLKDHVKEIPLSRGKNQFPKLEELKRDEHQQKQTEQRAQGMITFHDLDPSVIPDWVDDFRWNEISDVKNIVWEKFVYHRRDKFESQLFSQGQISNKLNTWIADEKIRLRKANSGTNRIGTQQQRSYQARQPSLESALEKARAAGFDC